jgi:hypothetical protein
MVDLPGTDHPRPGDAGRTTHDPHCCYGYTLWHDLRPACAPRHTLDCPTRRLDRFDAHTTRIGTDTATCVLGCRHALLNPAHPGPCERDS